MTAAENREQKGREMGCGVCVPCGKMMVHPGRKFKVAEPKENLESVRVPQGRTRECTFKSKRKRKRRKRERRQT
jgi:hypothetical protein